MLNWLAPRIIGFAAGVHELELSLSSKAMRVASHPKLASMLKHELSTYEVYFRFQLPGKALATLEFPTRQVFTGPTGSFAKGIKVKNKSQNKKV